MNDHTKPMLTAVGEGLAQLSPDELHLFALAVLHGVPVTKLSGSPQQNVEKLIGAQKKLRRFLTERGFGTADLEKGSAGGR